MSPLGEGSGLPSPDRGARPARSDTPARPNKECAGEAPSGAGCVASSLPDPTGSRPAARPRALTISRWDARDLAWDEEQRAADERMTYEYGTPRDPETT